jgi:prepilin-type N-terminal cleavage/methylation domain-containing protein
MNNFKQIKKEHSLPCFTLIELLVVMGILGILMAITILVINPAEYLRRARDTNRVSDLNTLKTALTLYSVDTGTDFSIPDYVVYVSLPDSSSICATWSLPALPTSNPWVYHCSTTATYRKIDGTGWVPVNLSTMASKPLSSLPIDPTNDTTYYYTFVKGGSFELNAITETQSYKTGSNNKTNLPGVIAAGTNLNLSPIYNSSGLVGYWNFDEGTGTNANDSSGNGNTGALLNGPTWMAGNNCKVVGCLSFNGVSNYVSISDNTNLKLNGDFSIGFWYKLNSFVNTYPGIISKGPANIAGAGYLIYYSGSSPYSLTYKRDNLSCNVSGVVTGNWKHYLLTYSGGVCKWYVDGSLTSTTAQSFATNTDTSSLLFGKGSDYGKGFIDGMRIYNRALSAAEVRALYRATK